MRTGTRFVAGTIVAIQLGAAFSVRAGEKDETVGRLVQYGTMHEAIGRQQDQGRVRFADLLRKPHFYGVAALEGLQGEATVLDGQLTVTSVDDQGRLKPVTHVAADMRATMLAGAYVDSWSEHAVPKDIASDQFDQFVADMAAAAGLDTSKPFVFTVEGKLQNVRLHVINGACPIHARLMKKTLAKEEQPFESEFDAAEGTIVGIYAEDAVGKLTHPATSTHAHLLFVDPETNAQVTGHIEQTGIGKGAVLRLPKSK